MKKTFPPAIFITGTDTMVGKTVISAILTQGLKSAYWKPIQSGTDPHTDTEWVKSTTELPEEHFIRESYCFKHPLSPHAASEKESIRIDLEKITMPDHSRFPHLIIEGAGGVLVPLNERTLMIDLIKKLNVPAIVVARTTLGTINHTLMTLEMLRSHAVPIFGVVLNGIKNEINRKAIAYYGKTDIIAEIEPLPALNAGSLQNAFERMNR